MKHKILYVIIGLILATALFVSMGHAKQKGTGLPGTKMSAQQKTTHRNTFVGILRKIGTGIGLGLDLSEYGLTKAIGVIQKADMVYDEYIEGKPGN